MNYKTMLFGAIVGLISVVPVDLHAFSDARKQDPKAKFDWALAVTRWGIGVCTGAIGGTAVGTGLPAA